MTEPIKHITEYQRYLRDLKASLLQTLPNHYALLNHIRSQAQEAEEPVFADAPAVAEGDAMAPIITFKDGPAATAATTSFR